jgi:hypothetical protein
MEIDEAKEKDLQKQLRRESLKRNWKLFSQSKLGMIGLGIVTVFLVLALLQPFLFFTGIWSESIYHPVVGYDQIIEEKLLLNVQKNIPLLNTKHHLIVLLKVKFRKKCSTLHKGLK